MQGFVQLHRKVADCWIAEDPMALALWVRILIEATHKPRKVFHKGRTYNLKPGELLFGLDRWVEKTGISREVIRRRISMLESDSMITRSTYPKTSVISIVNWYSYQSVNTKETRKKHAENTQTTRTEHQYNNVNNGNNKVSNTSTGVDFSPVIQKWNEVANELGLQTILGISDKRKVEIRRAYANYTKACKDFGKEPKDMIGFLLAIIECANLTHTEFHLGGADRDKWRMNFDYLMQKKVIYKVTETGSIA